MEPLSILTFVLGGIVTGALSKVGENITDRSTDVLKRKLPPGSETAKAIAAGTEIDAEQFIIDVEPIVDDPEIQELLAQLRSLVDENAELKQKLAQAIAQSKTKNTQENHDNAQGYQFNAELKNPTIGGNHTHYHGINPD
jgi:ribonuclease D